MDHPDSLDVALRALGRRIAELRRAGGVTQEALAERLGTGAKYVQHVERGRANPSARLLIRIALALDVPPAELFTPPTTDSPTPPGRPPGRRRPAR